MAVPGGVCLLLLVAWAATSSVLAYQLNGARFEAEKRGAEAQASANAARTSATAAKANAAEAEPFSNLCPGP